jgi:hypothetical protein
VERSTWTDDRLDDRFDHVDRELSLLRSEMREGFSGVRGEIKGVRGEINDLRLVIIRGNWTVMAGLIGVIAAILARGA